MKRTILFAILFVLAVPNLGGAQTAQKKRPATKKAPAVVDLRADAAEAAQQLKVLSRFLYVYGKIENGLETADEQARRGETSPALQAKSQQSKQAVASNISGLKAGLDKLAERYHGNERLQRQYLRVLAASEAVSSAEKLARENRFDEAGRALVGAAERLADLLVEVR